MDTALSWRQFRDYCIAEVTGICGQSSQEKGTMEIRSSQNLHRGPLGSLGSVFMISKRLDKNTFRKSDTEK